MLLVHTATLNFFKREHNWAPTLHEKGESRLMEVPGIFAEIIGWIKEPSGLTLTHR